MWMYYDCNAMCVEDTYFFNTREELNDFISGGMQHVLKNHPDMLEEFSLMFDPEYVVIQEVKTITAEEALKQHFS